MKTIKFLILFLLIALLGAKSYSLNENDNELQIYKYKVKQWENVASVADKFHVTEYTIRTSNRIFRDAYVGQVILIPNKNVTIYKLPSRHWNVRRVAFKFYVRDKDVTIFNYNFQKIIPENEHQKLPYGYYAAVPQLQEKNFAWPTEGKRVSLSGFGIRRNPFNRRLKEFHTGIDIPIPFKKIYAAKPGRVLYSGWKYGFGRCIIIEHTNNEKTVYAHLNRMLVKRGAYVHQNMMIAQSGNTGRSTGPHLHFEIRIKDVPANPWKYYAHGKRADNEKKLNEIEYK